MFCIKKLSFSWIGLLALMVLPAAAIDKPLGYERFTPLTVDSGIFTEATPKYVFEHYAQPLTLGIVQKGLVTDKRLIDIETHRDKSGNLTLSGVWIENKGDFEQESWLMLDFTYLGLIDFASLLGEELIPIDIERYDNKNGKPRYALIFQRNIHKAEWLLKLDMTAEQIRYEEEEFRLVDIDLYLHGKAYRYDGIMVRNTGPNQMSWNWTMLRAVDPVLIAPCDMEFNISYYDLFGWQATDVEWVEDSWEKGCGLDAVVLFVHTGRTFRVGESQTAAEASLNQVFYGRVIDLEGGPEGTVEHSSKWDSTLWQTIFCGY